MAADGFEEGGEGFLGGLVDAGGRFIQEQDARRGDEGAGDEDALLLAAGEAADGLVGEVVHADFFEGVHDFGAVGFVVAAEEAFFSVEAELDDLADGDGEGPIDGVAVGDVADDVSAGTCRRLWGSCLRWRFCRSRGRGCRG